MPQRLALVAFVRGKVLSQQLGEQAISADTRADVGAVAPQPAVVPLRTPFELSRLTTRILFGTLMGGAGAGIILAGGWVFTAVICLVVYQASQEFYGFVTSKVWTCARFPCNLPAPAQCAAPLRPSATAVAPT